jgi:hypothetical protein
MGDKLPAPLLIPTTIKARRVPQDGFSCTLDSPSTLLQ